MERIAELTNILMRLNSRKNTRDLGPKNKELLNKANCKEMARAQQNVLLAGLTGDDLWRLWSRNRSVLPDQMSKLRSELGKNHVLHLVLAEHEMILCFIADLDEVNGKIQQLSFASSTNHEVRKLGHIAEHLVFSEQHHQREEEIIFPEIKRRGYPGPLEIVEAQHKKISGLVLELESLVSRVDKISFDSFKKKLNRLVYYIVPLFREHIFIEGNIIFPLALDVIEDEHIWDRIKDVCDQIGYCGYDGQ